MSNVSQDFGRDGDVVNTGRALDLAISGNGFFMTSQNGQMSYTRAGTFNRDADNFIVSGSGQRLQGYMANEDGQLMQGVLTDLQVEAGSLPAKASNKLDFTANLKADAVAPTGAFDVTDATSYNFSQSSEVYDSLGSSHMVTQYFVKTGDNTWQQHFYVDGKPLNPDGATPPKSKPGVTTTFGTNGEFQSMAGDYVVEIPAPTLEDPDAKKYIVKLDLQRLAPMP